MSEETSKRYDYWFSGSWYKDDPIDDIRLNDAINESFKAIERRVQWERENADKIVKVRFGDLIILAKKLLVEADHMDGDAYEYHGQEIEKYATEILNLPEKLNQPEILH